MIYGASLGDEFDYLKPVTSGTLTIKHSLETNIAEGTFDFEVEIPQEDGPTLRFKVTEGAFRIGPDERLAQIRK